MQEQVPFAGVLIVRQLYRGKISAGFRFEIMRAGEAMLVGLELDAHREPERILVAVEGREAQVYESLSRNEKDQIEVFIRKVRDLCKGAQLARAPAERRLQLRAESLQELIAILKMAVRKRAAG